MYLVRQRFFYCSASSITTLTVDTLYVTASIGVTYIFHTRKE